jgi:hypothetical protein
MMRAKDEDKRDEWVAALRVAVQLSRDFTRPLQVRPLSVAHSVAVPVRLRRQV